MPGIAIDFDAGAASGRGCCGVDDCWSVLCGVQRKTQDVRLRLPLSPRLRGTSRRGSPASSLTSPGRAGCMIHDAGSTRSSFAMTLLVEQRGWKGIIKHTTCESRLEAAPTNKGINCEDEIAASLPASQLRQDFVGQAPSSYASGFA